MLLFMGVVIVVAAIRNLGNSRREVALPGMMGGYLNKYQHHRIAAVMVQQVANLDISVLSDVCSVIEGISLP